VQIELHRHPVGGIMKLEGISGAEETSKRGGVQTVRIKQTETTAHSVARLTIGQPKGAPTW